MSIWTAKSPKFFTQMSELIFVADANQYSCAVCFFTLFSFPHQSHSFSLDVRVCLRRLFAHSGQPTRNEKEMREKNNSNSNNNT